MYAKGTIVEYTGSKSGLIHFQEYEVESYDETTNMLTIGGKQYRLYERVSREGYNDKLKKVFRQVILKDQVNRMREQHEQRMKDKAKYNMKYL